LPPEGLLLLLLLYFDDGEFVEIVSRTGGKILVSDVEVDWLLSSFLSVELENSLNSWARRASAVDFGGSAIAADCFGFEF